VPALYAGGALDSDQLQDGGRLNRLGTRAFYAVLACAPAATARLFRAEIFANATSAATRSDFCSSSRLSPRKMNNFGDVMLAKTINWIAIFERMHLTRPNEPGIIDRGSIISSPRRG
jgi:hypothetical protein